MAASNDRVLIEIVTAANMAGIEQAKTSFLGLGASTLGLAAGLGILYEGTKSAIQISEAHANAEADLANAIKDRNAMAGKAVYDQEKLRVQTGDFITTNRDFVSSQTDVIDGYAAFIREGVPANDVQKAMNAALDISISEHIPLSQAVELLQAAESGRATGLKKLVGIQLENVKATGSQAEKAKTAHDNLQLVAQAYDGARNSLTPLQKQVNDLNNDWQTMATDYGPAAVKGLDLIAGALDGLYQKMVLVGSNGDPTGFWGHLQQLVLGLPVISEVAAVNSQTQRLYAQANSATYSSNVHARGGPAGQQQAARTQNVTINVNATQDPYSTARQVAAQFKKITAF